MNTDIELLRQKIAKLPQTANERSFYPLLCEFIQNYATKKILGGVVAITEESLTVDDKNIGFPDLTIRRQNGHLIGWWEIKLPDDSLSKESFREQLTKYKDSLENILITNLREWQVWQWDDDGKPQKTSELLFDVKSFAIGEEEKLENLLIKFFEGKPYEAKTPKQLALALAKKALLLSKQVEESFNEQDKNSDLVKLKLTFEKTLIQDISTHQFANMIAETMAYSLFLAFLEHIHRGKEEEITLTSAIDYLPTNVPILADLYSLVRQVSKGNVKIQDATQLLIDQLRVSQMDRIYHKLVEHKPGEDPVIQFYEPFLKEYDPKEREARGVYYTPKPVVDFIVKGVDYILREKFGKTNGLSDESVQLLDPATGTGTFLMSAIQEIYTNVNKKNITLGEEMVSKEFTKIVRSHILKHFYAFELMVAPYAIAHLKLTLLLDELGFNFSMTKNDNDPENDRLKIYLANALDNPKAKEEQGKASGDFESVAFPSIPMESEKARLVKSETPIIAIIGNPPYSVSSMNPSMVNGHLTWIGSLIEDYKKGSGLEKEVRLAPIQDDYIKFIRFAQWIIEKQRGGVVALITNNSYLDGLIHRAMRKVLIDVFDEIYILNLNGSSMRISNNEKNVTDESIFNIRIGTSIAFFIKGKGLSKGQFYKSIAGRKNEKFEYLINNNFEDIKFDTLTPKPDNFFFTSKDNTYDVEYNTYLSVSELFKVFKLGIMTGKDNFVLDYDKPKLEKKLTEMLSLPEEIIRRKYELEDSRDWKLNTAKKINLKNDLFTACAYRPFDKRAIYYDDKLFASPQRSINSNLLNPNIALCMSRQLASPPYQHVLITNTITEMSYISLRTKEANRLFPLYLFREKSTDNSLFNDFSDKRQINFTAEGISMFENKLQIKIAQQRNAGQKIISEIEIFYYIYAILHSPTYRRRYQTQLLTDYPKIPITSELGIFNKLAEFGLELSNLHLLGENPFDNSKTILDDPSKWGIKIGGIKPENLEDWKVTEHRMVEKENRVYVNSGQYFEGIDKEEWQFMVGGYQVCEKWLKDRKKANRTLSTDDIKHYMKIIVSLRETIRIMKEIDQAIPEWPIK